MLQRAEDGFAESFHGALGIHLGNAVELRFETALKKEIAEAFDEFFEVDSVGGFADVFAVADEFHDCHLSRVALLEVIVEILRFAQHDKRKHNTCQLNCLRGGRPGASRSR